MDSDVRDSRSGSAGRIVFGLLIIAIGIALLLDRMGYAYLRIEGRYWAFVLMVFGVLRLMYPPDGGSRRFGAWLVYLGLWGYVSEFHIWGLDYDTSWPLLVVAVGLGTIWRAIEGPRPSRAVRSEGP